MINNNGIITGIRLLEQILELKEKTNCYLIYINSSIEKRFERQSIRAKKGDPKTIENVCEIEKNEESDLNDNESERQITLLANLIINNNGTIENLYKQLDTVVDKLK